MANTVLVLSQAEVDAIRELLTKFSPDTWGQMSRKELENHAYEHGVSDVADFPDLCNKLGIGDES